MIFFFYASIVCYQNMWKTTWQQMFLLVKYFMNFVSDFQWYQIFSLRNAWLLVDIFSLNKHMGLLSLEIN